MIATVQVSCWSAQLRDYHSHNHENRHQILGGRNIRQSLSKYFGSHDRAMDLLDCVLHNLFPSHV